MTKGTAELLVKIVVEIAKWLTSIILEKGGRNKDDSKGNPETKFKSGKS